MDKQAFNVFMIQAYHRGLLTKEKGYAFLTIDFKIAYLKYQPEWNLPGEDDEKRIQFLRSTILEVNWGRLPEARFLTLETFNLKYIMLDRGKEY